MPQIRVGDRVAFSRVWLRNTGQVAGLVPFARGTVTGTQVLPGSPHRVVSVNWHNMPASRVLECNLVLADRLHLEPV